MRLKTPYCGNLELIFFFRNSFVFVGSIVNTSRRNKCVFLGSRGMNWSAGQTKRPRTASWFSRFVCLASDSFPVTPPPPQKKKTLILVWTPSVLGPELAARHKEHSLFLRVSLYVFDILFLSPCIFV